jgi:hypothetical protein
VIRSKVRRSQVTVSAEVRRKVERQQAAIANVQPLTEDEITEARRVLVQHMQPRESVMETMGRLSTNHRSTAVCSVVIGRKEWLHCGRSVATARVILSHSIDLDLSR